MRLIIAGSRHLVGSKVQRAIATHAPDGVTVVLDGGAHGVDYEGRLWAKDNGILVCRYDADWATHDRAAGPIRNQAMVDDADALLLIWDGKSRGSADVKRRALAKGIPVYEAILAAGS
jgi:hypothetical protein